MTNKTYRIVRFYMRDDEPNEVLQTGRSLVEVTVHCQNPETSSGTCTNSDGHERTASKGPWFDGFQEED